MVFQENTSNPGIALSKETLCSSWHLGKISWVPIKARVEFKVNEQSDYFKLIFHSFNLPFFVIVNFPSLVVNQQFESDVFKVNVILSNDITLKCVSPSHVADLLSVTSWVDSEGNTYTDGDSYGNISHLCLYLIQWVWKHEVKSFWNLSIAYLLQNKRIMLFVEMTGNSCLESRHQTVLIKYLNLTSCFCTQCYIHYLISNQTTELIRTKYQNIFVSLLIITQMLVHSPLLSNFMDINFTVIGAL